jgi:hypothetical protein
MRSALESHLALGTLPKFGRLHGYIICPCDTAGECWNVLTALTCVRFLQVGGDVLAWQALHIPGAWEAPHKLRHPRPQELLLVFFGPFFLSSLNRPAPIPKPLPMLQLVIIHAIPHTKIEICEHHSLYTQGAILYSMPFRQQLRRRSPRLQ